MGKRTFLPLAIMIATILPFLVGLIVLYPHLGQKMDDSENGSQEEKEAILEKDEDIELTQHVPQKLED